MTVILLAFTSVDEAEKFEYIFEKYKNLLLFKAREIVKDPMLAEDAASEAFLRIYRNLHKIEDPDSPQTAAFVVTIVRNVALTMIKKEAKTAAEEFPETLRDDFNLERHVLSEMGKDRIYALVDDLGEDVKSVFVLKFAYDMSHREIGETLGISENNVSVRLHRAKKRLKELLGEEGLVLE